MGDEPATPAPRPPAPPELGEAEQQVASIVQAVVTSIGLWAGPLPNPADFQAYEDTLPGAANRILSHFEREQRGRHVYRMVELCLRYGVVAVGVLGAVWGMYLGREALAVGALAGGLGVGAAIAALQRFMNRRGDK